MKPGVMRGVVLLVISAAIAGCGERNDTRVLFDGNFYRAKTSAVSKEDRKVFETVVRRPEQGINGALAAGEHESKTYCLKNFGTSEIVWTRGPEDPGAPLYAESGRLVLNGTCRLW